MIEIPQHRRRTYLRNCRIFSVLSAVFGIIYLQWLLFEARPDNYVLYWMLVVAECFNVAQAAGFWMTISFQKWTEPPIPDFSQTTETVDLFVTVCGEPADVVGATITAATQVRHPRCTIWVLDDGQDETIRALAELHSVGYITRQGRRGAKAGNINHALGLTRADYFCIFDADQIPKPAFLEATLGGFEDPAVAFVQTPQVYRNRFTNRVSAGSHDQQSLFYGPILRGKNGMNAVFSCGTNVVYRRGAIDDIGGLPEDSITEDLRGSLILNKRGYSSLYVSRILAEGLGPLDVGSYFNQQFRWGRGGLEILFQRRPYQRPMSLGQAFQYSLGFMFWFTGWIYLIYLALPVLFLVFGFRPIQVPNDYPLRFIPYVLIALATIAYAADFGLRFDGLRFTLASFPVQLKSLISTFFGGKSKFVVTPKKAGKVALRPILPIIFTMIVLVFSAIYGLMRLGPDPSVFNNIAWIIGHIIILQGFVFLTFNPERAPVVGEARAPEAAKHAEEAPHVAEESA
ncbi:MAG: glycosyltransferase [Coriobacteriales bacterium]|nr:glycosyltransferase [Coriobacteriales bacterium]